LRDPAIPPTLANNSRAITSAMRLARFVLRVPSTLIQVQWCE
jgi:hypothetical protein